MSANPLLVIDGSNAYVVTSTSWGRSSSRLVLAASLTEAKKKHGWTRQLHTHIEVRRARQSDADLQVRRDSGFTLIEVLVAVVIVCVAAAVVVFALSGADQTQHHCEGTTMVYQDWGGKVTAAVANDSRCMR